MGDMMFKASQVLDKRHEPAQLDELWQAITDNYIVDEDAYLRELFQLVPDNESKVQELTDRSAALVNTIRSRAKGGETVDAFLQQFSLDTEEGIVLMCLAEALLRIPDGATADALIRDRLGKGRWNDYLQKSESLLVNYGTRTLQFTNNVVNPAGRTKDEPISLFRRMVQRLGEPVVRKATYQAMRIMGRQFVLGRSIGEALKNSRKNRELGYTHSYDMLGEAAMTRWGAEGYKKAYMDAIKAVATEKLNNQQVARPSISIKLSALHPRYEFSHQARVMHELAASLTDLVKLARELDVPVTIDAEEMDRLELSLALFAQVYRSGICQGWPRFGMVVQAYSKRALPVLTWLNALAQEVGEEIPIRLVKGAYWDAEIKLAQQMGLTNYPVFTRKASTDMSYLACARYLLSDDTVGNLYPQFATHNAHTIVTIQDLGGNREYEFQRLHGMGKELYDQVMRDDPGRPVRIYAPVGPHRELLPYLVRRLLENGANSSFVHKLLDPTVSVAELVRHPLQNLAGKTSLYNDKISLPTELFGNRKNSLGLNMNVHVQSDEFVNKVHSYRGKQWHGGPLVGGELVKTSHQIDVTSPQDRTTQVGTMYWADQELARRALDNANAHFRDWTETPVEDRATALETLADKLEDNMHELIALCSLEAGKNLQDGIDEVREAVDFCRYYALQARKLMAEGKPLPGPTGEKNELFVEGRGTFVCISPWNFPLAIFLGQITAALATGNCVLAKPAETTGLIAFRAVQLAHEAGIPTDALQLLPGSGAEIGAYLVSQEQIGGVCFTGSTVTAQGINRSLAERQGPIVPLVAETGGQNAMLVDSTALPEQAVQDIADSAFKSAGQRCSALRVLYIQDDVADQVIDLLRGYMEELTVGDPIELETDVGPVIDEKAQDKLNQHIAAIQQYGRLITQAPLPDNAKQATFVAPTAIEIDQVSRLDEEKFGPILHIIRFKRDQLDAVIDDINGTGYGLTFGIHSRNETFAYDVARRIRVGNVYINRNQVGAIVGVQPFGGRGLSGTGPKAGGPHYLYSFMTEKAFSDNITAVGGNATLLSLGD